MSVRLKETADLVTSCVASGERPFVALEHLGSGTGRLAADTEVSERTAPETGAASVEPGDVLFGKLRPYLAKTWLADRPVFASTELLCLRPRSVVHSRWLAYLVASNSVVEWAVATSDGTKMPRTSWEKLAEYRIDLPPIGEQRAVADYLDRETARIDALVEKKHLMVGLLSEHQARQLSAVLCARDASGKFVEDSILGSLPAAWRCMRLRHCVRITVGVVVNPSNYFTEQGVPFIHGSDVRDGWIDTHNFKYLSTENNDALWKSRLRQGDVVVVRAGYPGRAAVVPPELDGSNCASILILRKGSLLRPSYLAHFLNSLEGRTQVALAQYGAAQEQINVSDIVDFIAPVPPLDIQDQIISKADAMLEQHQRAVAMLNHQIDLLREHRQALITEAVIGELDVPGAVA